MTFESFEAIMTYAIEKEKEAAVFYEDISKQEKHSGTKEVFESFANEERKHQAMLENFSKENVDHYKIEKIPDLKSSRLRTVTAMHSIALDILGKTPSQSPFCCFRRVSCAHDTTPGGNGLVSLENSHNDGTF